MPSQPGMTSPRGDEQKGTLGPIGETAAALHPLVGLAFKIDEGVVMLQGTTSRLETQMTAMAADVTKIKQDFAVAKGCLLTAGVVGAAWWFNARACRN